jgi:hypothetical protein
MKRALIILISAVFIASGFQVSIDKHYCGGSLFATKISLTGEKASCGMEQSNSICNSHSAVNAKCCEDLISSFSLNNNFFPEYYHLDKPFPEIHVFSFQKINLSESYFSNTYNYNRIFPPGENLINRPGQSEICVFRI